MMNALEIVLSLAVVSAAQPSVQSGDHDVIEMLRDAQVSNRNEIRQGRCNLRLAISRQGIDQAAVVDSELTWIEGDFLLKFRVADPSSVYFRDPMQEFGADWNFILKSRDGVRLYNSKSQRLESRTAQNGAFDPLFNLDPWVQLFMCCPPTAAPPSGRPWYELIGPHPAMKRVMEKSSFEYSRLPDGDRKQIRRDEDGSCNEIVFSSKYGYRIISMIQRDPGGSVEQTANFRYEKVGSAVLPAEASFSSSDPGTPGLLFTYTYSGWDVKRPVNRQVLSPDRLKRTVRDFEKSRGVGKPKPKSISVLDENTLRDLSTNLGRQGFAVPAAN